MSISLPDIGHVTTSQVDGLEIRLARGGRSDGVQVLLTSPWPESIYAYRAIWPEIEALGPLIAVDLPGFGRSEGRADLMSPEAMGDFVIKLAQHFGIDRMHAVGPGWSEALGPIRDDLCASCPGRSPMGTQRTGRYS